MPGVDDESLGGVLIAGFLEKLPFQSVKEADYESDVQGDKAVVHLWGVFLDEHGEEMQIPRAQAVRIPLVRESGRWYLDLLDI